MDNSITSAQAAYAARQKEEKEKQQKQQERNFDKAVFLATLDQVQQQNDLLRAQNKQLQEDSVEAKKSNRKLFILSIITICIAFATLIATIVSICISR